MRLRSRTVVSKKSVTQFKWMVFLFTTFTMCILVSSQVVDISRWTDEYDDFIESKFSRGRIVEFADDNDFCHSYVLIPGVPLLNRGLLIFAYFM